MVHTPPNMRAIAQKIHMDEEPEPIPARSIGRRLVDFIEHPWFLWAMGIISGIVGIAFYSPVLFFCGLAIVLSFHKAKVVDDQPFLKIQIPSYLVLCVAVSVGLYLANRSIQNKLSEDNISLARLIVGFLPKQADTPVTTIQPPHSDKVPPAPRPAQQLSGEGPTLQGGFHEVVDEIAVQCGVRGIVRMEDLKRHGFASIAAFGNTQISLRLSKDGTTFLFNFTGWAGGVPVTVKDNEITVGNEGQEIAERNYSENAFEIVDKDYSPVFQMIRTSATSITINGVFPTGQISSMTGLPVLVWVTEHGYETGSRRPADFNLKPLFKYPAWKYPHVFAES
jgi:hypothetical protein